MWNATYIVRGRQAIFGAFQLWCALSQIEVKINRIGEPFPGPTSRCQTNAVGISPPLGLRDLHA